MNNEPIDSVSPTQDTERPTPQLPDYPKPAPNSKKLLAWIIAGAIAVIGIVTGGIVAYSTYTNSVTTENANL